MKRSIAIKALSLYLSHNWAMFNEFSFDHQADWIIGFLEGSIGMRPPMYQKEGRLTGEIIEWTGTVGETWEPEEESSKMKDENQKKCS